MEQNINTIKKAIRFMINILMEQNINMMKNTIRNTDMIVHVFRLNSTPSGFLFAPPTP